MSTKLDCKCACKILKLNYTEDKQKKINVNTNMYITDIYRLFAAPSPPTHLVFKITGGPFNCSTTDRRYWNYNITWKVGHHLNISIEHYYIICRGLPWLSSQEHWTYYYYKLVLLLSLTMIS